MTTAALPDYAKRASKRERMLALLSDGKQHHMTECERIGGMRFGARIWELRKQGHDIETIHIGADETAYRMHVDPRQLALV